MDEFKDTRDVQIVPARNEQISGNYQRVQTSMQYLGRELESLLMTAATPNTVVHSPQGTGKTSVMKNALEQHVRLGWRVMLVPSHRNLAREFARSLRERDITVWLYLEQGESGVVEDYGGCDVVIIHALSLNRFSYVPKHTKLLLILDEVEALRSMLLGWDGRSEKMSIRINKGITLLKEVLEHADRRWFLSADVGDHTMEFIKDALKVCKDEEITLYSNSYKPEPSPVFWVPDTQRGVEWLVGILKQGKRAMLMCQCKWQAHWFRDYVESNMDNLKVLVITSSEPFRSALSFEQTIKQMRCDLVIVTAQLGYGLDFPDRGYFYCAVVLTGTHGATSGVTSQVTGRIRGTEAGTVVVGNNRRHAKRQREQNNDPSDMRLVAESDAHVIKLRQTYNESVLNRQRASLERDIENERAKGASRTVHVLTERQNADSYTLVTEVCADDSFLPRKKFSPATTVLKYLTPDEQKEDFLFCTIAEEDERYVSQAIHNISCVLHPRLWGAKTSVIPPKVLVALANRECAHLVALLYLVALLAMEELGMSTQHHAFPASQGLKKQARLFSKKLAQCGRTLAWVFDQHAMDQEISPCKSNNKLAAVLLTVQCVQSKKGDDFIPPPQFSKIWGKTKPAVFFHSVVAFPSRGRMVVERNNRTECQSCGGMALEAVEQPCGWVCVEHRDKSVPIVYTFKDCTVADRMQTCELLLLLLKHMGIEVNGPEVQEKAMRAAWWKVLKDNRAGSALFKLDAVLRKNWSNMNRRCVGWTRIFRQYVDVMEKHNITYSRRMVRGEYYVEYKC